MTKDQKLQVIEATKAYMDLHGMSQSDVAKGALVPARYLIELFRGNMETKSGDKVIQIADKYFSRLAKFVDFPLEKQYWEMRMTDQLKIIGSGILDAKEAGEPAVFVGETGCGKTYSCKLIQKKFPGEVFIVTVGASDNLSDLLDKVLEEIKVECTSRTKSARIRKITSTLRRMNEDGREPVLIFDEAEYMKIPALCAFKELYDALNELCALVLIGTKQLTDNIEKLRRRDKPGIPQLYRRIRYRIRPLPSIDRSFSLFLDGMDKQLRSWLKSNCDNYGELHDVLVPSFREADRTGEEMNVEFVKMVIGL